MQKNFYSDQVVPVRWHYKQQGGKILPWSHAKWFVFLDSVVIICVAESDRLQHMEYEINVEEKQ